MNHDRIIVTSPGIIDNALRTFYEHIRRAELSSQESTTRHIPSLGVYRLVFPVYNHRLAYNVIDGCLQLREKMNQSIPPRYEPNCSLDLTATFGFPSEVRPDESRCHVTFKFFGEEHLIFPRIFRPPPYGARYTNTGIVAHLMSNALDWNFSPDQLSDWLLERNGGSSAVSRPSECEREDD